MCDLGADEFIELVGGVALGVDPFVEVVAEPGLHHIGHLHIEVIAFDHPLQHQRYGNRITGGIGSDKPLVGGLDVIGSASGKDTMDSYVPFGVGGVLCMLDELLDRHRHRASLAVPHEVDILVLGIHSHRF